MIRSMTGFGRGEIRTDSVQCIVEIKTVNHRYADFTIKMPRDLMPLEERIRAVLKESVQRGKTDVFITYIDLSNADKKVAVDEGVVNSYFAAMKESSVNLGYKFEPNVSMLFKIPDAFVQFKEETDAEAVWEHLNKALCIAISNLEAMRETEGEKLRKELMILLDNCKSFYKAICDRSPLVPLEYKEKLNQRLSELLEKGIVDEQRLAVEVALFADKCSIDEEIARFNSHIEQFCDAINSEGSIGRRLDFIVQEMNREVNTMGSKANDIIITNSVISLKSELEKIREQIQNLE
ncbi:MAG: YicC family protein [Clostridia bacterium]|nr:YicC family protein [Clostridia bacterium]